jgi:hypothetical protein
MNARRTLDAIIHLWRAARHARQAGRESDVAFALLEREAALGEAASGLHALADASGSAVVRVYARAAESVLVESTRGRVDA